MLGNLAVDAITTADVLKVLSSIWEEKRVTAKRVRQWTSQVMRRANAEGYRADDPADNSVLQAQPKVRSAPKHHVAVPYAEVGDVVRKVREGAYWIGIKLAFEFLVLTACRSGEVIKATWDEVDMEGATWTVPAGRMKADKEHRVPLSPRRVAILREALTLPCAKRTAGSPVFLTKKGKPLYCPRSRPSFAPPNQWNAL